MAGDGGQRLADEQAVAGDLFAELFAGAAGLGGNGLQRIDAARNIKQAARDAHAGVVVGAAQLALALVVALDLAPARGFLIRWLADQLGELQQVFFEVPR